MTLSGSTETATGICAQQGQSHIEYYFFHPVTLQEMVPCLGETGYEPDYSWAITSKAIGCAFMMGCSIEKGQTIIFLWLYRHGGCEW